MYYTIESARDYFQQHGGVVVNATAKKEFCFTQIKFPDDWQYCPCDIEAQCIKRGTRHCIIKITVEIPLNNPANTITSLIMEITYLRERHVGLIFKDQMMLKKFIDGGIVDAGTFQTITPIRRQEFTQQ